MTQKVKDRLSFLINMCYALAISLIVIVFFKYVVNLVLPFIIAFVMVSLINPLARKITAKNPKDRGIVSVILMILLYVVFAVLLFFIVTALLVVIGKIGQYFSGNYYEDIFRPTVNSIWNNVMGYLNQLPQGWEDTLKGIQGSLLQQAQNLIGSVSGNLLSWVTTFGSRIPGFIIAFVFTVMLSFFISIQYEGIITFAKTQLPTRAIDVIKDLRSIFGKTIAKYLGAVLILMFITTVELSIGLKIIGIKNAILVAMGIAVFDALPVFGTGAVMIPWVVIELVQKNYNRGIGLIILYIVVSVIRSVIEPKIVGDRLGINPIVSIVSIYFGFKVFKIFGMIFMPMVTQVILELDKKGTINIFKKPKKEEAILKELPEKPAAKQKSSKQEK